MVSTRGMDARVEFLECRFEGLLAMRENWEKSREEDRQKRVEIRRQLNELVETVRRITTRSNRDESINGDNHTVNDDDTKKIRNPQKTRNSCFQWGGRIRLDNSRRTILRTERNERP